MPDYELLLSFYKELEKLDLGFTNTGEMKHVAEYIEYLLERDKILEQHEGLNRELAELCDNED